MDDDRNSKLRALVSNLRNRAKQSELRGHHSPEWCNGVRFAANEIEAAILDAEQPRGEASEAEALEDLTDMIGNINPDCCNSGFPIGAARRCLATITAALQQAEARAVAADARRYRWLRCGGTDKLSAREEGGNPTHPHLPAYYRVAGKWLDDAIDAAQEANREGRDG